MPAIDVDVFLQEYKAEQRKKVGRIADMQYLSVNEYAERTHRNPGTVRHMCADGRIEGAMKNGKTWLIPVEESRDMTQLRDENARLIRRNAELENIIVSIIAVAQGVKGGGLSGVLS